LQKKKIFINIFVYLILFFVTKNNMAQTPLLRHLTDEQGLPCLGIYDVIEDKEGFLWFGSDKGLLQYDGVHFKSYAPKSLRSNTFTLLQIDSKGRIWGVNFSGQMAHTKLPTEGGQDSLYLFEPLEKIYQSGLISYTFDKAYNIHIVSNNNPLLSFSPSGERIFFSNAMVSAQSAQAIAVEKTGNIWYIENGVRLVCFDVKKQATHLILAQKKTFDGRIIASNKRVFWIQGNNNDELSTFECSNFGITPAPFWRGMKDFKGTLNSIWEDEDGLIWVATSDGVWCLDKEGKLKMHILENTVVGKVIRDREGTYWFTTPYNGIFNLPSTQLQIFQYPDLIFRMAYDGKKNIYLATAKGELLTYNSEQRKIVQKRQLAGRFDWQGFDWVAGKAQGLFFARRNTFWLSENGVLKDFGALASDKQFLGSWDSAVYFSASSQGALSANLTKNGKVSTHAEQRYSRVHRHPIDGSIWFANSWSFFVLYPNGHTQLIPFQIGLLDFDFAADGKMWVATPRNGLLLLENQQVIKNWTLQNGLLHERVRRLKQDKDGTLWIVTENGLQHFDPKTEVFRNFSRASGLLSQELYDIMLTEKEVWIATPRGVQLFSKDKDLTTQVAPRLHLLGVQTKGKTLPAADAYHISIFDDNIRFSFVGISPSSNGHFKYRYRMLGLDSNWIINSSNDNSARYQSLKEGNYTFQIQMLTEDGRSSEILNTPLSIRAPFWRKWWFYAFFMLIVVVSLTLYFNNIIKRINERNIFERKATEAELAQTRAEESLRRAQLSALKAQMNPHFIFNALNSIQAFIFLNDKNSANTYLGKFSDLMRKTLDMSQQEAILLEDEMQMLETYLSLENMRFRGELDWDVQADENIDVQSRTLPPLVIQPYVENAIKHGLAAKKGERKLHIFFREDIENQLLICEINDNGIGREKSMILQKQRHSSHQSFSTSATEQRLELLNKGRKRKINVHYEDLYLENGESAGTKVLVYI
jgi:ligand-binding sensor domain-containing protein/two-component sensor histidine kinase